LSDKRIYPHLANTEGTIRGRKGYLVGLVEFGVGGRLGCSKGYRRSNEGTQYQTLVSVPTVVANKEACLLAT
jgi:hypothetical protein